MLSERFALAERDLIEQRAVLHDGEWVAGEIRIKLEEGLGFSAGIDAPTAQLLAMLDGQRTLGEVVFELADREQADRETLVASALGVVRGMLELGFLVRADPSSPT
jgi:predicted lipoprotein